MRPALYPVLFRRPLRGGPDLDLNFAAMTVLDPRVTYTGASLATLTDATGAIAYKPHNLILYSNSLSAFSHTGAAPTSGTDDPFGGTAAWTWTPNVANADIYTQTSIAIGTTAHQVIWFRRRSGTGPIYLFDNAGGRNLISEPAAGWNRLTASSVSTGGNLNVGIRLGTSGDSIDLYAFRGCLGTTSSQANDQAAITVGSAYFGPRFTYDPVTHAALGLLIEEQRTNLLVWSEALGAASWTPELATVSANVIAAPDGNTTADKLVETAATGLHDIYDTNGVTLTVAQYTHSRFYKAAERTLVRHAFASGALAYGASVDVNLSAGTISAVTQYGGHTGATAKIEAYPNGWYRVSITCTCTVAVWYSSFGTMSAASTYSFLGDITKGVYSWGAQLEAGAFATSYIPTTSASVTRAADSATMTGSNFSSWFNATQGTFVWEGRFATQATASDPFLAHNGTISESLGAYISGGAAIQWCRAGGVTQAANTAGSPVSVGSLMKIGAAFSANDFRASSNGSAIASDAVGAMPSGIDRLGLAGSGGVLVGGNTTNAPIARLRYYPTALTNAQLQALTT